MTLQTLIVCQWCGLPNAHEHPDLPDDKNTWFDEKCSKCKKVIAVIGRVGKEKKQV